MSRDVVVVSAVRTAIGTFGGSLKDVPPTELGALVVRASLARAQVDGKDVEYLDKLTYSVITGRSRTMWMAGAVRAFTWP